MKTRATIRTKPTSLLIIPLLCLLFCSAPLAQAGSRLIPEITFEQPNGSVIELRGEGNEYRAIYETLDGYTVLFAPEDRSYHYATVSANGEELVSSGLRVGEGRPETVGLVPGIRIDRK